MLLNSNINGYYNRQEGESESNFITARFAVESDVQLIKKTNSFISAVFLMGKDGETISTQAATQDSRYNEFMESALGKQFESRSVKYLWVGNHEQFDSSISYSDVKYSINDYALSLITPMNSRKGFIIIDVSKQKIMDMFAKYELGENSIVALLQRTEERFYQVRMKKVYFYNRRIMKMPLIPMCSTIIPTRNTKEKNTYLYIVRLVMLMPWYVQ